MHVLLNVASGRFKMARSVSNALLAKKSTLYSQITLESSNVSVVRFLHAQ